MNSALLIYLFIYLLKIKTFHAFLRLKKSTTIFLKNTEKNLHRIKNRNTRPNVAGGKNTAQRRYTDKGKSMCARARVSRITKGLHGALYPIANRVVQMVACFGDTIRVASLNTRATRCDSDCVCVLLSGRRDREENAVVRAIFDFFFPLVHARVQMRNPIGRSHKFCSLEEGGGGGR